jgi:succinate dehydrogenase / fumarate reductase cytochrome b subunit
LYLGHRLSGLGLIAYMTLHIVETANRMRGEQAWAGLMALFASPPFKVIEYLLFLAAVFHAMNGLRLILVELGFFLGKPKEPIYPYSTSVLRHRPLTYVIMIITVLAVRVCSLNKNLYREERDTCTCMQVQVRTPGF